MHQKGVLEKDLCQREVYKKKGCQRDVALVSREDTKSSGSTIRENKVRSTWIVREVVT